MVRHFVDFECGPRWRRRVRRVAPAAALVAVLALVIGPGVRPAGAHGDGSYPRTFNLDWRNRIDAVRDSRYDLLVHSSRVLNDQLDSLRMLNPAIRRLTQNSWYVYYNAGPSGYAADWGPFDAADPSFGFDRQYWDLLEQSGWWLYAVDSSGTRYHAAMAYEHWCGNFTSRCPKNAQGQRLCDVYADFLADNLLSQRHVEGVFFDYTNDGYGWMNWYMWGNCPDGKNCNDPSLPRTPGTKFKTAFDCDQDGVPDPPESVDVWWNAGMNVVMSRLRARLGPEFLLVGNGQHHYTQMNGAMIERFPFILGAPDPAPNPLGYKWNANIFSPRFGYLGAYELIFSEPRVNLIDASTPGGDSFAPDRTAERERFKRFTLGSALLGDGYHGVRGATTTNTWWEPEWDLRLGWPTSPPESLITGEGVELWGRRFDNGDVWVNPTAYPVVAESGHPGVAAWDAVVRETRSFGGQSAAGSAVRMEAPYPNPAAGEASISFVLPEGIPATLMVFDLRGRLVREIWSGIGTGSLRTAVWDGDSDLGYATPAGVYFAAMFSQGKKVERRLVRLR